MRRREYVRHSDVENTAPEGNHHRMSTVGSVELRQDALHVCLDGVLSYAELDRNELVGLSRRYTSQHLDLAFTQYIIADVPNSLDSLRHAQGPAPTNGISRKPFRHLSDDRHVRLTADHSGDSFAQQLYATSAGTRNSTSVPARLQTPVVAALGVLFHDFLLGSRESAVSPR
jgi:hypothetical protein